MAIQQVVLSTGGFPIGQIHPNRSYWAIKRRDRSWICEEDIVSDLLIGRRRIDWTLDICSTSDWKNIAELWMFCPPNPGNPGGQSARLPITVPGTAFQLKVGMADTNLALSQQSCQAQLIGRVTDIHSGDCECFIYDYALSGLIALWKSNVFTPSFGSWRENLTPIGRLAFPVVGLNFTDCIPE